MLLESVTDEAASQRGPRRSRRLDVRLVLVVLVALLVRRRRGVEADRRHGQHDARRSSGYVFYHHCLFAPGNTLRRFDPVKRI